MAIATNDARAIIDRVRTDPVWFARNVLGQDPWEDAERIMMAMAVPKARVAVKSCHASSKTHTAATLVLWAVAAGGICVTTAPTWEQVESLLWKQIASQYQSASFPVGGSLSQTKLEIAPDIFAIGLSTNEATRFQGFHSAPGSFLLIIKDESNGVRPAIDEAIEGIRAGGDVRTLDIGNPLIPSGPFYDAFTRNRALYVTITIDGLETPNLIGLGRTSAMRIEALRQMHGDDPRLDENPRPYLIDRRYVWEKLKQWGEDHPLWHGKVRGQFPVETESGLVSLAWCEAAKARPVEYDGGYMVAGVDVASGGENETVVTVRSGPDILAMQSWSLRDARGPVVAFLRKYEDKLRRINVDDPGVGRYFVSHLKDVFGDIVVGLQVGLPSSDPNKWLNKRAEWYEGLANRLRTDDINGLTDEDTIAQLVGIQRGHNSRGAVTIETKDEMRHRGVASPDRADSLMLAFASEATAPVSASTDYGRRSFTTGRKLFLR